jgi:hypothetical protein
MQIPCDAQNFPINTPFQSVNGQYGLICPKLDLIRVAITVGKRSWAEVIRSPLPELGYRAMIMCANYRQQYGYWVQTSAFKRLDSSEKRVSNFYLGLAIAKLFDERQLGAPWLGHYETFLKDMRLPIRGQRPDLISRSSTRANVPVLVEAKGRMDPPAIAQVQRAKRQAQACLHPMHPNRLNVASVTYFDQGSMRLLAVDPPKELPKEFREFNEDEYLQWYYRPYVTYISDSRKRSEDPRYEESELFGPFILGIRKEIYEAFGTPRLQAMAHKFALEETRQNARRNESIGTDGIRLRLANGLEKSSRR